MRRFRRVRPSCDPTFEAVEASLAAGWTDLEPDPLFVRRLRTQTLNGYVLAREGDTATIGRRHARTEVGRLGRACLFATFALGMSAVSALAASQSALPGETLYSLKLRLEEVRLDVLPAHLHDDLAAHALMQRIEEVGALTAAGQFDLAIAMMPSIEEAYERVAQDHGAHDAVAGNHAHLEMVLEKLLDLPRDDARVAVRRVLEQAQEGSAGAFRRGSQDGQWERETPIGNAGASADPGSAAPEDATRADPPSQADGPTGPDKSPRPEPTRTPKPGPSHSNTRAESLGAEE